MVGILIDTGFANFPKKPVICNSFLLNLLPFFSFSSLVPGPSVFPHVIRMSHIS